jgi:hypothetical protein
MTWPELSYVAVSPKGEVVGYILAKMYVSVARRLVACYSLRNDLCHHMLYFALLRAPYPYRYIVIAVNININININTIAITQGRGEHRDPLGSRHLHLCPPDLSPSRARRETHASESSVCPFFFILLPHAPVC